MRTLILACFATLLLGCGNADPAKELIKALKSTDSSRLEKFLETVRNTDDTNSLVPILVESLKSKTTHVRRNAAYALGTLNSEPEVAVPALIEVLSDDEDFLVRTAAAKALGKMGSAVKAAIPALASAMKDKDLFVKTSASDALAQLGSDAVPALIEVLTSDDTSSIAFASLALGKIGSDAVAPLMETLTAAQSDDLKFLVKNAMTNAAITNALGAVGPPAVPALIKALTHERDHVRLCAATALGQIGTPAHDAVPDLTRVLNTDKNTQVAEAAAHALGAMAADGRRPLVEFLRKIVPMFHDTVRRRQAAIRALAGQGPSAIPDVANLLDDKEAFLRGTAVHVLVRIKPAPLSHLRRTLTDQETTVREVTVDSLPSVGEEAVPLLIEAIKDDNQPAPLRWRAAEALAKLGSSAVPSLTDALRDQRDFVRVIAVSTLGELGPAAKSSVPALIRTLKDEKRNVSVLAAETLGKIGPDAFDALPALQVALEATDELRDAAEEAIREIRVTDKP